MRADKRRLKFLRQQLTGGVSQLVKYLNEYVKLYSKLSQIDNKLDEDTLVNYWTEFWKLYPIRKGKLKAAEAFEKNIVDDKTFQYMMSELHKQIAYKAHCDNKNIFHPEFPFPQGWLNQHRWEEETPDVKSTGYITPKNTIDDRLK